MRQIYNYLLYQKSFLNFFIFFYEKRLLFKFIPLSSLHKQNRKMKNNKLEVGDKLVVIKTYYDETKSFTHTVVERVTKTQAITSSGVKLRIEGDKRYFGSDIVMWEEISFSYCNPFWQIETAETEKEEQIEISRRSVNTWFSEKKFTDEEKEIIYNLLNTEK
jgi:hypothetical protein